MNFKNILFIGMVVISTLAAAMSRTPSSSEIGVNKMLRKVLDKGAFRQARCILKIANTYEMLCITNENGNTALMDYLDQLKRTVKRDDTLETISKNPAWLPVVFFLRFFYEHSVNTMHNIYNNKGEAAVDIVASINNPELKNHLIYMMADSSYPLPEYADLWFFTVAKDEDSPQESFMDTSPQQPGRDMRPYSVSLFVPGTLKTDEEKEVSPRTLWQAKKFGVVPGQECKPIRGLSVKAEAAAL